MQSYIVTNHGMKNTVVDIITGFPFCFSLTKPEVFSELITLIITEPPKDVDESSRYKLPHVAAELLCCEVPQFRYVLIVL